MPVSGDWTYTESGGNATITDYSGHATPTIPTSLDGYPVIALGDYSLDNKALSKVTIGHAIDLGDNCLAYNGNLGVILDANVTTSTSSYNPPFEGCNLDSDLTITSNVTSLPTYIFRDCNLTSVTIPDSVTSMGIYCFADNSNLTSVTFGTGMTYISSYCFEDCGLTEFVYPSVNFPSNITYINQRAFHGNDISYVEINSDISVDDDCFGNNGSLTVHINANVNTDDILSTEPPFNNCSIGTNYYIGATPTSVPRYLFSNSNITSFSVPDNITSLGTGSFRYNSNLTSATIPNQITSMGSYTFADCGNLTSVTFGTGITSIPSYCFEDSGLTEFVYPSVNFPSNITYISQRAFKNNSLNYVEINSGISVDDECFANNGSLTVYLNAEVNTDDVISTTPPFNSCSIGSNLTIGATPTEISHYLFRNSGLTSVEIPDGISLLGSYSFGYNTGLQYIWIYDTSFSYYSTVFSNNNQSSGVIYGYELTDSERVARYYEGLGEYDFESLDQTIELQTGNFTLLSSSATPVLEATITLGLGNIDLVGDNDITLYNDISVDLETGTITFSGKDITVTDGTEGEDTSGIGGLELFIFVDII